MSLIEAENLFCERDDRILFGNLTFSFDAGELVQIKGPNGAGKSTLLRIICGIYSGYDGQLLLRDPDNLCYFGHKISVKLNLTALENLRVFASPTAHHQTKDYSEALSRLGMEGYEDVLCSDMSEGQRRRVALARVLLSPARIFILDEPFSSLDVDGVAFLEKFLEQLSKQGNLVIFTSHHKFASDSLRILDLGAARHD